MTLSYLKAKNELLTGGEYDCQQFFEDNNYILELAYYNLFHKDTFRARKLFLSITDNDIRAHWGAFFTSLCEGRVEGFASYLELRNFYEIDFNILFTYYLGEYVETICQYTDWLAVTNPEIYKYTGRVFLKNNYADFGLYFLQKGIDNFYNDPELHYLLAEYYSSISENDKALKYATSCLQVLPAYFPAERLIQTLTSNL